MSRRMRMWIVLVIATLVLVVAVIVGMDKTLQGQSDTQNTIATHESSVLATHQAENP